MKLYARRGFEWAEDGLVGLWSPVSTGGTQSVLLDCNPATNNHGTLTGYEDLNTGWVGSSYGSVLDFDGVNDHVADCGNTSSFAFIVNPYVFTIEVWFKLNSISVRSAIAGSTAATSERGFVLLYETGIGLGTQSIRLFTTHGTSGQSKDLRSPSNVVVAGWNHAVVIGRTTAANSTMVINGQQVSTTSPTDNTLSAGAATRRMSIGNDALGVSTNARWTAGQIASFAIWNRSLTISDAQSLYNFGPGGVWQDQPRRSRVYFSSAGFKAYWARRQSQLIGGGV